MTKTVRFRTVQDDVSYDLIICACGYEKRSRFIASELWTRAKKRVAIGFDYHLAGSLKENVEWFDQHGFFDWKGGGFGEVADIDFLSVLQSVFCGVGDADPIKICVDISSFSSVRLANIVEFFWMSKFKTTVLVDFLYAPGKHYAKSEEDVEIQFAGPVSNQFAGWACRPELPVVAILGLGMEYERSLGAFEMLSPAIAYTFATIGTNAKITKQINKANEGLYPLVPEMQRFIFDIGRPLDCLGALRSLVSGALKEGRPIFVPLGPKIFTLASLIIASEFFPNVGVWRISTGRSGNPIDIVERGDIVGFSVCVNT